MSRLVPGESGPTFEEFLESLPPPRTDAMRYMRERDLERARERERRMSTPEGRIPVDRDPVPFRPKRLRRYQALFERCAEALPEREEIQLQTNGYAPMSLRFLRFPDGSKLFEYECDGSYGATPLYPEDGPEPPLLRMIINAFMSTRVRPIAGQEI